MTAVNSHPQLDAWMFLQGLANLERATHRFLRTVEKKECHPVPRRHADEFAACLRRPETFGASDNLVKFLQQFNLLVVQQFGKAHDVD